MNFNAIFLRSFRILLFPLALLYALVVIVRNYLYDKNILKSASFNFPLVSVGNLVAGGTGKSPMVEYLVNLLAPYYRVATLSRGYKRKTKGYALAGENTTALEIGDEPMQFHIKFPDVPVAVGEERLVAIPQLLHDRPDTQCIILDDAYQHRNIKPGLNILLTEYNDLYTHDFFLPTGDLRDQRSSAKRAQIIVVTKCPEDLDEAERKKVIDDIDPAENQKIFFAAFKYGEPYHILNKDSRSIQETDEVLLVCGIANPNPLKKYLAERAHTYYQIDYSDHKIFSIDDLKDINKRFENIRADNKFIVTTEKDAVRLLKFREQLKDMQLYVLPVKHQILFNQAQVFNTLVIDFIQNFSNQTQQ